MGLKVLISVMIYDLVLSARIERSGGCGGYAYLLRRRVMQPLCLLTVLGCTDWTRLYYPRESISCFKAITVAQLISLWLIGRIARAPARVGVLRISRVARLLTVNMICN